VDISKLRAFKLDDRTESLISQFEAIRRIPLRPSLPPVPSDHNSTGAISGKATGRMNGKSNGTKKSEKPRTPRSKKPRHGTRQIAPL
jgi:hypothetical protein